MIIYHTVQATGEDADKDTGTGAIKGTDTDKETGTDTAGHSRGGGGLFILGYGIPG